MKMMRFSPAFLWIGIVLLMLGSILYFLGVEFSGWSLAGIIGGVLGLLFYVVINYTEVREFSVEYSTRQWANTFVFIVCLIGVIIVIQMIANKHNHRLDLTSQKSLTLAPITKKLLQDVPFPIIVKCFYNDKERQKLQDLCELYALGSNNFKYELLSLNRNPGLAKKYGVNSYDNAVVEVNGKRKIVSYPTEEKMINAILALTNPQQKIIYLLSGHGEFSEVKGESAANELSGEASFKLLKKSLETENYRIKDALFAGGKPIPDDASIVIIGAPKAEFSPVELQRIDEYLKKGGSIFIALGSSKIKGLKDYLKTYGIVLGDDIVIDPENYMMEKNPLVPIIPFYFPHPITEKFTTPTIFPFVHSVTKSNVAENKITLNSLARSGEQSWAETDVENALEGKFDYDPKTDQKGPIPVAVVGEFKKEQPDQKNKTDEEKKQVASGKLVIFGSADFLLDHYFEMLGNKDLFLNTIHWMTEEESLITIRRKAPSVEDTNPVFLSKIQARMVFILSVIVLPVLILSIGMVVTWRRRQRG